MEAKLSEKGAERQMERKVGDEQPKFPTSSLAQAINKRKRCSSKERELGPQVVCHRCFKISKFMLKQMNELIRLNFSVDSYF